MTAAASSAVQHTGLFGDSIVAPKLHLERYRLGAEAFEKVERDILDRRLLGAVNHALSDGRVYVVRKREWQQETPTAVMYLTEFVVLLQDPRKCAIGEACFLPELDEGSSADETLAPNFRYREIADTRWEQTTSYCWSRIA